MSESNNFCGKCGKKLDPNNNFCPKCGLPVKNTSNIENSRERFEKPKKKGFSKKKKVGIGIGVIILLFFILVAASSGDSDLGKAIENAETSSKETKVDGLVYSETHQAYFDDSFYEKCMSKPMEHPTYGKTSTVPNIQEKIDLHKEESCKRKSERPNCLNCGAYYEPYSRSVHEMKTLYDLNNLGQFKEFHLLDNAQEGKVVNYAVQCDTNVKCIDEEIDIDTRIQIVKEMIIQFTEDECRQTHYASYCR